jgi:hypothetical protein
MNQAGHHSPRDTAKETARRRRARNWAMLAVLLGLSALFYAITIAKMKVHG